MYPSWSYCVVNYPLGSFVTILFSVPFFIPTEFLLFHQHFLLLIYRLVRSIRIYCDIGASTFWSRCKREKSFRKTEIFLQCRLRVKYHGGHAMGKFQLVKFFIRKHACIHSYIYEFRDKSPGRGFDFRIFPFDVLLRNSTSPLSTLAHFISQIYIFICFFFGMKLKLSALEENRKQI